MPPRAPRSLRVDLSSALVRALASSLGAVLLTGGLLGLLDIQRGHAGPVTARVVDTGVPLWESAYSERYPGCVSMPLWPLGEVPVALVTRTPEGTVDRVPLGRFAGVSASAVGEADAIGACR